MSGLNCLKRLNRYMERDPNLMTESQLRAVLEAEDHYRTAENLGNTVAWRADLTGKITFVSRNIEQILAVPYKEILKNDTLLTNIVDRKEMLREWAKCIAEERNFSWIGEYKHPDRDYTAWVKLFANPRRNQSDEVIRWYGYLEDVTETQILIRNQAVLVAELNHRVKNSLATVQSIVHQTFRSLRNDPDQMPRYEAYQVFCDSLMERLQTLASAHDILTDNLWKGAGICMLAKKTLEALMVPDRMTLLGPSINFNPNAALLMAMIFHELGTNAIKYGAWSNGEGHVNIDWKIVDDTVMFTWIESGGPEVTGPRREGFGTKFISRNGMAELAGRAEILFDRDGLRCSLSFPLSTKVWTDEKNTVA